MAKALQNEGKLVESLYDALVLQTNGSKEIGQYSHYTFYFTDREKAEGFAAAYDGEKHHFHIREASCGGYRVEAHNLYDAQFSLLMGKILGTAKHMRVFDNYRDLTLHQSLRTDPDIKILLQHAMIYEQIPLEKGRERLEYFVCFSDPEKRDAFHKRLQTLSKLPESEHECRTDDERVPDRTFHTVYVKNQVLADALEAMMPRSQIIPAIGRAGNVAIGERPLPDKAVETLERLATASPPAQRRA